MSSPQHETQRPDPRPAALAAATSGRRGRKRALPFVLGAVALLVAGGITIAAKGGFKKRGIRYHEVSVERGELRSTILATGVVQPENRLEVKPPIPGRIERILVEEGQRVHRGQILAWMSSTERAALLDTARAKGPAEVKYWEDAYKATPIIAPLAGIVILKAVERGATVTANDSVLSMSDRLIVRGNVDETDIAQVKLDQKVEIVLDAFPKNLIGGKVVRIAYDAKTVNSVTTYAIDVLPAEVPAFMKSGMTANVTFIVSVKDDALVLPAAAVKRDSGKSFVLVPGATPKDEPAQREIQIGITDGKRVEVASGLEENDVVLVAKVEPRKGGGPQSPFSPFGGPGGRGGGGGGGGRGH